MAIQITSSDNTITLLPTADTSTRQEYATTNYNTSTLLYISGYSGYQWRSFLKFDLSSIPVASVKSAKVKLYKHYVNTNGAILTFVPKRVTADFDPAVVTWNNPPVLSAAYGSPITFGAINLWSEVDITTMVNEWLAGTYPNYGVGMDFSSTGYRQNSQWRSAEYAGYAPYLEVVYETTDYQNGSADIGPIDLSAIYKVASSTLTWSETKPGDSTIVVKTAVATSPSVPNINDYGVVTNGGAIHGFSIDDDLEGKDLWIKVEADRGTGMLSPRLNNMQVNVINDVDSKRLKIALTDIGRLKYPVGLVTVDFTGSLSGPLNAYVEPFTESFEPVLDTLVFNPHDVERITANINCPVSSFVVTYRYIPAESNTFLVPDQDNPYMDEHLSASVSVSVVVTNVGGVPL